MKVLITVYIGFVYRKESLEMNHRRINTTNNFNDIETIKNKKDKLPFFTLTLIIINT